MSQRTVVTISRQLGSGGSAIGLELAQRLNLRYADRDILKRAAETLGVAEEDVEALEERVESVWQRLGPMFWVPLAAPAIPAAPMVTGSALFEAESTIIQALASREDVVIVGRGGAHLLKNRPGVISVYVHAAQPFRIERIARTAGVEPATAASMIQRSDRERAAFHRSLAQRDWCDTRQYDLCADTSTLGIDNVTDALTTLVSRLRDR
jgi:cytidylate kinase